MAAGALEALGAAYEDPTSVIAAAQKAGTLVVRTLGVDAPREWLLAAGILPVRLVGDASAPTPRADALMGSASMGARGKRLLEPLIAPQASDVPLLITHADAELPQIFAALRELARKAQPAPAKLHFLDWLHLPRESSRRYNLHRFSQLKEWLKQLGGETVTSDRLTEATAQTETQCDLLREIAGLRSARQPRISGTQLLRIVGASAILPPDDHMRHLRAILADAGALPPIGGKRIYVTGSAHEHALLYDLIESCGAIVVGEDHEWGLPFCAGALRSVARATRPEDRARRLVEDVDRCGAEMVLHLTIEGDEAAPWDIACLRPAVPFLALRTDIAGTGLKPHILGFLRGEAKVTSSVSETPAPRPTGQRSRKSLESVATFGAYQREWFSGVRQQVADGAPFAVVNANAPQEILRAMDVPFVVNQWWASIVAAKQQSRRYLGLLEAQGYPTDVEAYSSQGLAAALDQDPELAPWGGLPKPDFVHAVASSDPTLKIFDHWARETGAEIFVYERTIDPRSDITTRWWDDLPERWDEAIEAERIDLLVAELETVIASIERKTGRSFSHERFREVMDLVNEQELYYRRTRDLIAATVPAPISIVDSMPATMVPQWHRGTVWARDAAKAFYEEVAERARTGAAAVPNERVRLMWVGRGLWSDMGFYQRWEESHGAVFVWSMYLALAADGYIRSLDGGRDPMRALAARFLTMGDELRMPTWAGPWHVHEAETHAVDGAVALRDADPFAVRALVEAGIPVLELDVDNFNREGDDADAIDAMVTRFIEGPAGEQAKRRAGDLHART